MITYDGRDLESMVFAVNYRRWIFDTLLPFLGNRLVEVGAGSGTFSSMLWRTSPEKLLLVEPSVDMYRKLSERFQMESSIHLFNATFREVAGHIREQHAPNSIVYLNVLEHVEDDLAELHTINKTLTSGGRTLIFVPALQFLMGPFDRAIGHFRRYSKKDLEHKCERAGFRVIFSRYFDVAGVVPWWIKYKLLQSNDLGGSAVRFYDSLCVPVTRGMESLIAPPIGKNLVVVAEK